MHQKSLIQVSNLSRCAQQLSRENSRAIMTGPFLGVYTERGFKEPVGDDHLPRKLPYPNSVIHTVASYRVEHSQAS